jgi:hypothetical protein
LARRAIDDAFVSGFRLIAFLASGAALAAAATAAATIQKAKLRNGTE